MDESIKCGESYCRMEVVLNDDKIFTYQDGGLVYGNGEDITLQLIDEILLISSKARPCQEDSCGFHVHMSDTRPGYNLDGVEGKIFLLNALALWCGIEGITDGEQNTTFSPYVRAPPHESKKNYAEKLDKLNLEEFKIIYNLAIQGELENSKLLDYLDQVYFKFLQKDWPYEYHGLRYFAFNIYFLWEGDRLAKVDLLLKAKTDRVKRRQVVNINARGMNSGQFYEDPRQNHDVRLQTDLWDKPLRIEFRGHTDLMKSVMGEIEPYEISEPRKWMVKHEVQIRPEQKASIFYEKLTAYLDTINLFFETAKTNLKF